MRSRLAPLAAVLALAACSPALNPEQLDPYRDTAAACRALFDAIFSFEARCGVSQALAESMYDSAVFRCDDLDRPTVSQDTSGFQACVETLATIGCWQDFDTICGDIRIAGTVPAGGACAGDADCAPGLYDCHSFTNACGGTCRAYTALTGRCGGVEDPPCADGLYCDAQGSCQPRVAQGNGCTQSSNCQDDLRCVGVAAPATCVPAEGVPCAASGWCDSSDGSYYCPVWDATPLCRKQGTVPADAARCGGGKQCPADQYCEDGTMQCRARSLGGSCTSSDQCLAPAYCEIIGTASSGTCRVPSKVGEPCVAGLSQCEFGAWCSAAQIAAAGTCSAWPKPNEVCGVRNGELVGCIDGWCKPPDVPGGVKTCSPYSKLGEHCTDSQECGGGGDLGGYECVESGNDRVCARTCPL